MWPIPSTVHSPTLGDTSIVFRIFYHIPGVTGTKRRSSPKRAKSRRNQASTFHDGAGVVTHVYREMASTLVSKPPFWCLTSCRVDENSALHYLIDVRNG